MPPFTSGTQAQPYSEIDISAITKQAMNYAGDLGRVVKFLEMAFKCRHPQELNDCILEGIHDFGYESAVKMHIDFDYFQKGSMGELSEEDHEKLDAAKNLERIQDIDDTTYFNYEYVSLMVKGMPNDTERRGELRDVFATMMNGAHERLLCLIHEEHILYLQRSLIEVVDDTLAEICAKIADPDRNQNRKLPELLRDIRNTISDISTITDDQHEIRKIISICAHQVQTLCKKGLDVEPALNRLNAIMEELIEKDSLLNAKQDVSNDSVELF